MKNYALVCSFIFLLLPFIQLIGQDIQILLPTQYDGKANSKQLEYEESFYDYNGVVDTIIDLTQYKEILPDVEVPNSLKIVLPEMSNAKDTTLLLGFIKEELSPKGYLVLLLATNYETNKVTFYIDSNLDQDYTNDEPPVKILGGKRAKEIELHPENSGVLKFSLSIPKRLNIEQQHEEILKEQLKKSKKRAYNKLLIGGNVGVGVGGLNYSYDNLDLAFPTWYNVRFTERALGLNLNYESVRLRFSANATLTNHYYYTSYLNVQFAEPRGNKPGVLTERNIDTHSLNRLQVGGTVAYKIRMSRFTELQPFIAAGKVLYLSDNYFSDNRPNKEVAYPLSSDLFYEVGGRFDFIVGYEKSLFIDIASNWLKWRPDNFLEGINQSNLSIDHQTWKINFGYQISLW